jgi:predicted nucleic acid-binding protein
VAHAFLPDTSCLVPALCSWHEHHLRAIEAIGDRLSRRQRLVVAAPALIEAYSVLTRLPAPRRLAASEAMTLLDANFARGTTVVALNAAAYRALLRAAPDDGVFGGRIYDAVIAACARKARARTLLTFNTSHFTDFAGSDLEIVAPA